MESRLALEEKWCVCVCVRICVCIVVLKENLEFLLFETTGAQITILKTKECLL